MVPQHLEVVHLVIVGVAFLASHRGQVIDTERAGMLVAPGIGRLGRQAPGPTGIDLARDSEVGMLAQRKVITAIAQVEATVVVLAKGRHQDAALVLLAEGEIAKGHRNGQRQVLQHHICRAGHDILLGLDLSLGELEVEVRVLMVITGGIAAILDVVVIVLGLLGDTASEEPLALLCDNVGNVAALGLEVIFHDARLVLAAIVLKHRRT